MRFTRIREDLAYLHRLYQESLLDTGVLRITMTDDVAKKRVQVDFEQFFLYEKRDESYAAMTVGALGHTPQSNHWIYRVENSSRVEQFHVENYDMYRERPLAHYLIATSNEVIDVLSEAEPLITLETMN